MKHLIADHLYDTDIFVSNTSKPASGELCGVTNNGTWMNSQGQTGNYSRWYHDQVTVDCSKGYTIGQYVTLKRKNESRGSEVLTICEVYMWGYQYEGL